MLSIAGYRVSPLHPLWSVSWPTLAKITKLYGMWLSWTGRQHLVIQDLHTKFGSFVRVGPNDISVVEEDAVHSVFGVGGLSKGRSKADPNAPANLLVLTGEAHANRRRLWNKGMSNDSLKEYEMVVAKRASQLTEELSKREGQVVDLSKWIGFFTMDFMGDMAFGGGFETLRDGEDREHMHDALQRFAVTSSVLSHVPYAAQFVQLLPIISRDLIVFRGFALSKALQRLKSTSVKKDLWYHLSDDANLEKERPALKEVVADGALAIIAGSDTTSSALSTLFFLLMNHPMIYEQLETEIDRVYPTDADPLDATKHGEMPYLSACINEALRLYPPVPTNGPREVPTASTGKVVSGRFIPPGTQIYIPPYSLHRDPRYFVNPTSFLPERWLGMTREPAAFIPFSFGPANCVGRNLAKREMMMVMSLLMQTFRFAPASGFDLSAWPDQLRDHFIVTRGALYVNVTRRKS
ncbi:cytochrome P450 [Gymnopus androsaceus JB14]|uniref:Cytochrome P450 n=1 Tax=Gymnopus androsaceus JB14 TaxID=1447944 RepID=A0A6A4HWI2_9AGAR|nr:cytochrome P450 [Gymnopus androsaceus JB14]